MRGRETDQRRKSEPEPSFPPALIHRQDEDLGTRKPVSFTVKETLCPRMTQQPVEQCDFQEKGVRLGVGSMFPRELNRGLLGRFPVPGVRLGGYGSGDPV